jgi:hypothetical protein
MRGSSARALFVLVAGALALFSCADAGHALASGPGGPLSATALLDALAARFGPAEREPAFDALRPKLARAALVPSRVFDDSSLWSERGDLWRSVEFAGAVADGGYRIGLRAGALAPRDPGDYRGRLRLTRTGDGCYEWTLREELAAGPVRPTDLAAAASAILRGAEAGDAAAARAAARTALPRTSAALVRLFRVEALSLERDSQRTTTVRLVVRLVPDAIRPAAPRYAAFLDRYASPMRLATVVADTSGRVFWTLEAADNLWTLRLRIRAGSLVPLEGPADGGVPRELRATIDYSTKMGIFRVGVQQLVADVSLVRREGEKGFTARFGQAPEWQLPFLVKPFLQASLRYPFEEPGSEAGWSAIEQPGGTLLVRHYRLRVRESWIVRWLGGLAGDAVSEFRRGAEAEADRFTGECLLALRDDLTELLHPAPTPARLELASVRRRAAP